jgi:hypothetical protein
MGERLNFIENYMRSIGSKQGKIRAGPGESFHLSYEQVRHCREIVRRHQVQQPFHADAVDDDGRIIAILMPLAVGGDDRAIVFNSGFRPDPADDAQGFH